MKESVKKIVISLTIGIIIVGLVYFFDEINNRKLIKNKEEDNTVLTIDPEDETISKNVIKCGGVVLIILGTAYWMLKEEKVTTKQYRREWEEVLPPILAESVIDGKIGLKEFIMTTIVDLATRGNIEIIDNETIHLITIDGLEPYEEEIIKMLFHNETIKFSEIKEIFRKDNETTGKMYEKIIRIKQMIIKTLEEKKIYSKAKRIGLEIIRDAAIMAIVAILLGIATKGISLPIGILPWMALLFVGIKQEKAVLIRSSTYNKRKLTLGESLYKFIFISVIIVTFLLIILNAAYLPNLMIICVIIAALTILALRPIECTYTEYGKKEKKKVLELKNYIVQYSLMKERDLADTILWDKYLAYSIAFGIANKVTDKIYSEWLTTNIALQLIEEMIRLY